MSFNNKPTRPDSADTKRLRAEYVKKANEFRDSGDPATRAKLKDEKAKLFQRVVEQVNHERKDSLGDLHKSLIREGRLKTKEQMAEERAKLAAKS